MTAAFRLDEFRRPGRHTLNGKVPRIPEFSHLGHAVFTKVGNLGRHEHLGQFEICLIVRGHVTWWARERTYELRGGDVYFTWPDEPHGGLHELMHPCEIYWLVLTVPRPSLRAAGTFLHLPAKEARELCRAVHALPDRHLRGAEKLAPYYQSLFKHLLSGTELDVVHARALLQRMVATLVALPRAGEDGGFVPPGIARARGFLDGTPRPWPNVKELAALAGMSVSHFHARFVKEVGMAPMEYAHRQRLERAAALLREPDGSVTSVAERLGYCSSQHLAACFKRYLGMTPGQARR
ncbi:MAG: AraC family transcriptional regulator [Planctomycetota bacterium]|nr:AraC family transcriptional regulator [Planctomycetota bacterium]